MKKVYQDNVETINNLKSQLSQKCAELESMNESMNQTLLACQKTIDDQARLIEVKTEIVNGLSKFQIVK